MTHDAERLLGAYALGALDPDEQAELELHLEQCTSCQERLAEYEQVTEGLLLGVGVQTPPEALRKRLMATIGQEAQSQRTTEQRPGLWERLRWPQAAWAGVGLALVTVNLILFAQLQTISARTDQLLAQQYTNQTALAVMTYPSSRVANLEQDSVRGSLIYDETLTLGVLNVWGLEPLEADQAYQLWLIDQDGERTSAGLLTPSQRSAFVSLVVWSPVEFEFIQSIGLTIEPAEGSPNPTGPRVLGTELLHTP